MLLPTLLPDHETVSRSAADWLLAGLIERPNALVCLASGGTPTRCYEHLAEIGRRRPDRFARMRVLKLDEWGGIPLDGPATCETALRQALIDPLGLGGRYQGFASQPADPVAECLRIQTWLATQGPIDLCVLGLGLNGHLGFNEPAGALQPHAHVATLSAASLGHAMIAGEPVCPTYGLTLGMADLLQARRILLLVTGPAKREILARLLAGGIRSDLPASYLWLHPAVTVLCDSAALGNAAPAGAPLSGRQVPGV
jgi:galactosamine-6-phosphate isomerase